HSAARLDTLGTEQAYVVLAAARRLEAAGHKVVHLEIGEPDMPTPPHVVEAGVRALRDGLTRYALAAGVPELRDAIARSLAARSGSRLARACSSSTCRTTPPAAWRRRTTSRRSPTWRSATICGSSRTRCTGRSATTGGATRSPRSPACRAAP